MAVAADTAEARFNSKTWLGEEEGWRLTCSAML